MNDRLKFLKEKALNLPKNPGVYLMKNKSGKIIYVGKAKALKNRVNSYFTAVDKHTDKVYSMVMNVHDFDYILTDSEFEALVLECSLIKQHSPKYNILLKDDKGYHYIKVTNQKYRKIKEAKQKLNDDATYIGPYTSMYVLTQSIDEARKIFKLPSCNINLTGKKVRNRPCLNYYINQCNAPCQGKITAKDNNESVEQAIKFLTGDTKKFIEDLTRKMLKYSSDMQFEKAAEIRDKINALKKIKEKQKVISTSIKDQDIISFARSLEYICFEVLRFKNFRLADKDEFIIKDIDDEEIARSEFIKQYYTIRNDIPKHISIDGKIDDKEIIESWLSEKSSRKVRIFIPQRGQQQELIKMCKKNAYETLARKQGMISGKDTEILDELSKILGLNKIPMYIESYDISNIQGSSNVASMVVFENAKPKKSAYKRFKIKEIVGQDDYGSMTEVINRRFNEYEKAEDKGFAVLPDLILLDGGKGHVKVIKETMKRRGIDVPVFGMVKDSKHRTRAITDIGEEISIKSNKQIFSLITKIQDETHRFAIAYHHNTRKKSMIRTQLTQIDGIGEKKAQILLKQFKSIKKISNLTVEEISATKGISNKDAIKVAEFFADINGEKNSDKY